MGASITLAGESLIAQKFAAKAGLSVARFIFANVPGLDPSTPVNRAAAKPPAGQIVHTHVIQNGNAGYVNPNQVVYSAQIGSDVGDWDFNWIGLETVEGVLLAVAYVALQQKRRNIPPMQIGNNLTRNFLVAFDGAQALTGITIDASTWQHDFTVRLAGIDERERLSNRDIYGRACFIENSLQLEKVGGAYQLKPGIAYIEGIRLVRSAALPVVPPALPTTAWLDVVLQRELSDVVASWSVVFGTNKADYTDALGVKHYCVPIADLTAAAVTDRRAPEPIKGTTIWNAIANIVSGITAVGRAIKLAVARKIKVEGAITGEVEFDGSGDVTLSTTLQAASEMVAGGAKAATQALTDAGVDDATFITPKKLRWGIQASLTQNGYLILPSWLFNLVLQWGLSKTGSSITVNYPLQFTKSVLLVLTSDVNDNNAAGDGNAISAPNGNNGTLPNLSGFGSTKYIDGGLSTHRVYWFALGV